MTKNELIKHLEETKRILVEEVETEDLTDYARYKAYVSIESAIDHLKENEDKDW